MQKVPDYVFLRVNAESGKRVTLADIILWGNTVGETGALHPESSGTISDKRLQHLDTSK